VELHKTNYIYSTPPPPPPVVDRDVLLSRAPPNRSFLVEGVSSLALTPPLRPESPCNPESLRRSSKIPFCLVFRLESRPHLSTSLFPKYVVGHYHHLRDTTYPSLCRDPLSLNVGFLLPINASGPFSSVYITPPLSPKFFSVSSGCPLHTRPPRPIS